MLYTHYHADHLFGLDDLRVVAKYLNGPVPALLHRRGRGGHPADVLLRLRRRSGARSGSSRSWTSTASTREPFEVLGQTRHADPAGPRSFNVFGFRIGDVAYCTDVSEIPEASWPLLDGVRVLVIDALRYKPHPAHFGLNEALEVIERVEPGAGVPDAHVPRVRLRDAPRVAARRRRDGVRRAAVSVLRCGPSERCHATDVPTADLIATALQPSTGRNTSCGWDRLDAERSGQPLVNQLAGIDLERDRPAVRRRERAESPFPPRDRLAPVPTETAGDDRRATRSGCGHEALARGEVAVLLVAGGQGRRLGFENPKGMYPVGPVSNKTLFQIHAEKVLALGRRYGKPVPFLVMTSPATHAETEAYFAEQRLLRPRPRERLLLPAGHDAGPGPGHRPAAAGSAGRAVHQPQRPRRHADRAGRSGPARRARATAASGTSSTSRWTTRW